jgi:hypothetical protein
MADKKTEKFKHTDSDKYEIEADFEIRDGKLFVRQESETDFTNIADREGFKFFNGRYGKLSITTKIESDEPKEE